MNLLIRTFALMRGQRPKISRTQKSAVPDLAKVFVMAAKAVKHGYAGFRDAAKKYVVKTKFRVPKAMPVPQPRTT